MRSAPSSGSPSSIASPAARRRRPTRAPSRCRPPPSTCSRCSACGRRSPSDAQPVTGIDITDSSLDAGVRPVLLTYDNATRRGRAGDLHRSRRPAHRCAARQARQSVPVHHHAGAGGGDGLRRRASTAHASRSPTARQIAASLLVAADGRSSPLREAAGIKVVGWSYPQIGIVTTVRHDRPHGGRAVQHFLPAGPFAILPLTGNRSCITWTEDARARRRASWRSTMRASSPRSRSASAASSAPSRSPARASPGRWSMHLARRYVGAPLRAHRRCRARRASHRRAGPQPRLPRCRRADRGHRRQRARSASTPATAQALDPLRALAPLQLGGLGGDVRRPQPAVLPAMRRCCARHARSGSALVDRIPALKRFFVSEAAGLTGERAASAAGRAGLARRASLHRRRRRVGITTTTRPAAISTTGT